MLSSQSAWICPLTQPKTETMCIGDLAEFYTDGSKSANVTRFKYLGSVTSDCSRIQATLRAFGQLRCGKGCLNPVILKPRPKSLCTTNA